MSNIQKAFKNKAKCGLRMAVGGFLDTAQEATPTSMFSGPGGSVGTSYASPGSGGLRTNQRWSGSGSGGGGLMFAQNRLQQPVQPSSVPNAFDNRIMTNEAIENSNLTMSEKASLGLGTTSADVSALRKQTDALKTLRDNPPQPQLQQPQTYATGGIIETIKEKITGEKEPPPPPPSKTIGIRGLREETPQPFVKAGVVQGGGTRTSDSVPAVVGEGEDQQKLALSKGEGFLVVSNNTMDNPVAMDQIRQILADSNGGKEPKMPDQGLRAGVKKAADSGFFAPTQLSQTVDRLAAQEPPPKPAVVLPSVTTPALGDQGRGVPKYHNADIGMIPESSGGNHYLPPQNLSFIPDADQSRTLRSGAISNAVRDPNTQYGESWKDATDMKAPNGGGYITAQPGADGLRKAAFLAPSAQRWEDGPEYKAALAQNAKDEALLAKMQRDRIERTAAMPGATQGDLIALANQRHKDELAAQATARNAELGLRQQMVDNQTKQMDYMNQARIAQAQKAEYDDRLDNANKLLKESALDEKEIPAFLRYVNENHVGGERQEDGSFKKTGDDFERLTKAEQQKMLPGLLGKYLQHKDVMKYGLGSKSSQEFTPKPASEYQPGEDKLQLKDIDTNPEGWWKLTSDDPTDMTLGKYMRSKLWNQIPGSISDDVTVSTDGRRIRTSDLIDNRYDANGFLVKGKLDERRSLRKASGRS